MKIEMLTIENIDKLIDFERESRETEPDTFIDEFNADDLKRGTLKALKNPVYSSARCMMCLNDENRVIGCIDFSVVSSYSFGGNLQVYVDWVYVLKEFRHMGVGQFLFAQMEEYIKKLGVGEYFLFTAENDEAQKFYRNVEGAEIEKKEVLSKQL